MNKKPISSPDDVDEGGWRGRIRGVTRIGGKAGIAASLLLALLVCAIVYGISIAGHRKSDARSSAASIKPADDRAAWWRAVPNGRPLTPNSGLFPGVLPKPEHVPNLATPQARVTPIIGLRVPDLASEASTAKEDVARAADQLRRARDEQRRRRVEAAMSSSIVVRLEDLARDHESAPTMGVLPASAEASSQRPAPEATTGAVPGSAADDPASHNRDERLAFLRRFVGTQSGDSSSVEPAGRSAYEIDAGTLIPATLISGINADLPGLMIAQVRDDVFDSRTGRYRLIPHGARLIGEYDSRVIQGERRVLVVWNRLIYPDGTSLLLNKMEGVDPAGYAGFGAKVDDHLGKALSTALLVSVVSAGAQLSQPQNSASGFAAPGIGQTIAGAVGQELADTSLQLTQRQLQQAPTLEVPPGYLFDVLVDRDVELPRPYRGSEDAP